MKPALGKESKNVSDRSWLNREFWRDNHRLTSFCSLLSFPVGVIALSWKTIFVGICSGVLLGPHWGKESGYVFKEQELDSSFISHSEDLAKQVAFILDTSPFTSD